MDNEYLEDLQNDYNNFKDRFKENKGNASKEYANKGISYVLSYCFSESKPYNSLAFTGVLPPILVRFIDFYSDSNSSFNIYKKDSGVVQVLFEDYVILIDMETGDYTIKEGTRIK